MYKCKHIACLLLVLSPVAAAAAEPPCRILISEKSVSAGGGMRAAAGKRLHMRFIVYIQQPGYFRGTKLDVLNECEVEEPVHSGADAATAAVRERCLVQAMQDPRARHCAPG